MSTFTAKNLIIAGLYTALLIVSQLALSAIAGIEIVTVLLLVFCYMQGVKKGVAVATSFSLIRCFVFGFTPNVLLLYMLYYNLFAVVCGFVGGVFKRKYTVLGHVISVVAAAALTAIFTLMDCAITPLIYGFSANAAKAYYLASLPVMIPHVICAVATVSLLFFPLVKALSSALHD